MKKNFIFKSMLMIALMCMPFIMASCSDDDDEVTTVTYSMGCNETSGDFNELYIVETTYQKALGVSSNTFTMSGSISECDNKVKAACKNAESTLKSQSIEGHFLFVVTNYTSQKEVYSYQIN